MFTPLSRRISAWVNQGLLTAEQAKAILHYEKGDGNFWVSFGIVGIGVTAIATGVISLVAANWQEIPAWLKIFFYFIVQATAGLLFLKRESKQDAWREAALALFIGLFWAGIGLFSQTFNLAGEGWQACAFWLVISLPAVALAKQAKLPALWTVGLELTALWWVMDPFNPIENEKIRMMIGVSVPLFLTAISFWAQAVTGLGGLSEYFKQAFTFWGLGAFAVGGTLLGNVLWEIQEKHIPAEDLKYLLIPWAALTLAVLGSLARKQAQKELRIPSALFLLTIGVFVTTPILFDGPLGSKIFHQIVGAGGFIAIAAFGGYLAAIDQQKKLYELATQLIALRFIVIYFQVFGTLSTTGVGLVFSGLVILGVAYFWKKMKGKLLEKLGRRSP